MMKKLLFIFGSLLLCGGLYAQSHIQVVQDATGVDFEQHSMAEFRPGEYVIAGTVTPGVVHGTSDILVLMTDGDGNILWSNYLDYGEDEYVGAVMVDADQNIILTGYIGFNASDLPNKDLLVVKLDSLGNLVGDVVIRDVEDGFGYSLYGFDIEDTNSGDYLVTGTGAYGATSAASKYGFVLRLSNNLAAIQWGNRYQSLGLNATTEYDSFNDILKVTNHPDYGEVYLLTGSGTDNVYGDQMVTNE